MPFKEHIYSILLVSDSEKFNKAIMALLPESDFSPIHIVKSINAAQRRILECVYDIVIINTPLPDDFGTKFAIDLTTDRNTLVILFIGNDLYETTYEKVMEHGVLTIHKPTSVQIISQALDWMRAAREKMRKMEKKTVSLEDKMAEIRIVNHAKWALIEHCNMTEADAHHYIEKQAMDRCVTRKEIAQSILQTYK
ncbi:MAG: ANTAR domain-containing protein [Firmicutes bacterium]|nr:ANTAR domain-containing protein [Bacillota bacterium]